MAQQDNMYYMGNKNLPNINWKGEYTKEQVKALIAIETKLKQEETNKKLAAIALETERLNAEKKKVTADAEAYEISKKYMQVLPQRLSYKWYWIEMLK